MKTPHATAVDRIVRGYQIHEVLQESRHGAVYRARSADGDGPVVLQELRPSLTDARARARAEERLQAELATLRRIEHPAFARILDVFQQDGAWFVVREYVSGAPVPIGMDEATWLAWVPALCESLAWLHAMEPPVFLRALRPEHLVVGEDGAPRWISYGLRSLLVPRHAHTGLYLRGDEDSPYAAFEQRGGTGTYDARSEVYALGALLYHLLTEQTVPDPDQRLFGGADLPAPSRLRPGLAATTDAALLRALAIEPRDRYSGVRALMHALRPDLEDANETMILEPVVAEPTVELPLPVEAPTVELGIPGEPTVELTILPEEPGALPAEEPAEKRDEAPPAGPPSPERAAVSFTDSCVPTLRLPTRRALPTEPRFARGPSRTAARWAQTSLPTQLPPTLAVPRLHVSPTELILGLMRPRDTSRIWIFLENHGGGVLEGTVELPADSPLRVEPRRFHGNDVRLEALLHGSACPAADREVTASFTVRSNGGEAEVGVTFRVVDFRLEETVLVPEGTVAMGSDDDGINERPQHTVFVPAFRIDRTPVTNGQFERFTRNSGYAPEGPWRSYFSSGAELHPVVGITWNDALAYAKWAGGRLPTEAEWEKAARGTDRRRWPWGDLWDTSRLNCVEASAGQTTPVDAHLAGASPYGVLDMVGNVLEWTMDVEAQYPYRPQPGKGPRILRGGSFQDPIRACRCSSRVAADPESAAPNRGFRVARPI